MFFFPYPLFFNTQQSHWGGILQKSPIFEENKCGWTTRVLIFLPKVTPGGGLASPLQEPSLGVGGNIFPCLFPVFLSLREQHSTAPVALGMEIAFIQSLECFSTEEQIYRDDTCLCFNTFKHLDSSNFKVNKFQDRLDYFFLKFSFLINYFLYK